MLFKPGLLAIGFAIASQAAAVPAASVSHVATYDTDFATNELGLGPPLPATYLDLQTQGWGVVSRAKNAAVGGLTPNTPYNYILTNSLLAPQGAFFAAAKPYNKVKFNSFYFGFVAQTANGAIDTTASDTLTVQGYDKTGAKVPGATFQKGFTGAGVSTNPVAQVKFTFPSAFPAVYKLGFSYTQPTANALIIDTGSYTVST